MKYGNSIDKTVLDKVLQDMQKISEVTDPKPGLNYKSMCPRSGDIYLIEHPMCYESYINDKGQTVMKRKRPQLVFRYQDAKKSASMHSGKDFNKDFL